MEEGAFRRNIGETEALGEAIPHRISQASPEPLMLQGLHVVPGVP
jgi:hypothetical protein